MVSLLTIHPFMVFALFQSPMSMKSVLQAAWLLTSSFGNLIVILISKVARIPSQVRKHDSCITDLVYSITQTRNSSLVVTIYWTSYSNYRVPQSNSCYIQSLVIAVLVQIEEDTLLPNTNMI